MAPLLTVAADCGQRFNRLGSLCRILSCFAYFARSRRHPQAIYLVMYLAVALASLTCSISAAEPARQKIFGEQGEYFQMEGHDAFILWPSNTSAADQRPTPWVFYAPTLAPYPDSHEEWMHRQFLAAGVAVAGIDVGEAFGNTESRQLFDRFYDEVTMKRTRRLSTKPCLLGRSRGGLWVSSWAADHPERFAGLAGIYPVFDLRSYPGLERASKAYKLTAEELGSQLDRLNPIARCDAFAKLGLPVFIIHGDSDKVVPLEANSAALASRYAAAGHAKAITVRVAENQGHNHWEGFFRCQELVDFVIRQAKSNQ